MKSTPRRAWHVNLRALAILGVVAVAVFGLLVVAFFVQTGSKKSALLAQAQKLARQKPPRYDLAGPYLNQYLLVRPDDPDALELRAEILGDTASAYTDVMGAIIAGEQVLRVDPAREAVRRRLLKLHLRAVALGGPDAARLQTASLLAVDLLKRADDAEAHRLAAQVAELLSAQGKGDKEALAAAIREYRLALERDHKDIASARSLASLYASQKGDPASAEKVLDALVAAEPTARAHLARYAYFLTLDPEDRDRRAAAEMAKAVALAPDDVDIRIDASADALRRNDVEAARRHLDAIPEKEQASYKVRLARGTVELRENRADAAIEDWRQGLIAKGGTDEDLTWRLAFILVSLGRTDEAAPLIDRYRRLTGGLEPTPYCRFLYALRDLKENRPGQAIGALETLKLKAPAALQPQLYYALGQAYEATRDEAEALDAYAASSQRSKKWTAPRLARLRLLQSLRPDEAEDEVRKGLLETPDDPALLVAQARVELQKQLRRPRQRRDWTALEEALKAARKGAPGSGGLALVEADYAAQAGRPEAAVDILSKAVQHDKKDVELWTSYATLLARRGETDEALLVLERAADPAAAGDQTTIRIARARLLTAQGHIVEGPGDARPRPRQAAAQAPRSPGRPSATSSRPRRTTRRPARRTSPGPPCCRRTRSPASSCWSGPWPTAAPTPRSSSTTRSRP